MHSSIVVDDDNVYDVFDVSLLIRISYQVFNSFDVFTPSNADFTKHETSYLLGFLSKSFLM
jgi:hypothetical protein